MGLLPVSEFNTSFMGKKNGYQQTENKPVWCQNFLIPAVGNGQTNIALEFIENMHGYIPQMRVLYLNPDQGFDIWD